MRFAVHGTKGPFVVKLAGIAGGIRLYDEEVARAAEAGFRVLAVDVSGDRRDDPPQHPLSWDSYAADVIEAMDRAGAQRAVLWGTSFGCLISLAVAARHPDRIAGLLLTHPPDPEWRPGPQMGLLAFAERRGNPDVTVRLMFSPTFLGLTSWEVFSPALLVRLPGLTRRSLEAATPGSSIRRKLQLLFGEPPGLPQPGTPVEILASKWDLVAPCAGARRLAARIPGAKIHLLNFSGHAAAFTRPRAHIEIVLAALKRLTEAPDTR